MSLSSSATQSPREQFFATHLIPTGQLASIFLRVMQLVQTDQASQITKQSIMAPLGCASLFALTCDESELGPLTANLVRLRTMMLDEMQAPFGGQNGLVLRAYLLSRPGQFDVHLRAFEVRRDGVLASLASVMAAINESIGFQAATQNKWLVAHSKTPLGRINKWRTFVRHSDWRVVLQALGLSVGDLTDSVFAEDFGNERGRSEAARLWANVFAHVEASAHLDSPRQAPAADRAPGTELCSLVRLDNGSLIVRASLTMVEVLSTAERGQVDELCKDEASRKALQPLHSCIRKEWPLQQADTLAATLKTAQAWRADMTTQARAHIQAATERKALAQLTALQSRLAGVLSGDEQALLAEMFAKAMPKTSA